jgi:hypothetical protein
MRAQAKALAVLVLLSPALFLIRCAEEVQSSPTEAVLVHLTPNMQGQKWRLGQVETLQETPTELVVRAVVTVDGVDGARFFSVTKAERYEVREDLVALFKSQVFDSPETYKDMAQRCATRVAERWHQATTVEYGGDGFTVKAGEVTVAFMKRGFQTAVGEAGLQIVSAVNMTYPSEPKAPRGQFQDIYLYKSGRWERQGIGHLMDIAPDR